MTAYAQSAPSAPSKSFDSLAYAKRMEAVGFTRQQAEALAEEQSNLIDERLATKADLDNVNTHIEQVKLDLITEIEKLRLSGKADLIAGLAQTKIDLIRWLFAISGAQAAVIIAVLKMHF